MTRAEGGGPSASSSSYTCNGALLEYGNIAADVILCEHACLRLIVLQRDWLKGELFSQYIVCLLFRIPLVLGAETRFVFHVHGRR